MTLIYSVGSIMACAVATAMAALEWKDAAWEKKGAAWEAEVAAATGEEVKGRVVPEWRRKSAHSQPPS